MFITFSLKPIEAEAADKISSLLEYSERSEQELRQLCANRLSASEADQVQQTLALARSLETSNPDHPSMRNYLSHPLRVARISLQLLTQPSARTVLLGLLHNVFEVTGMDESDLIRKGYDGQMAQGIRLLTIDRQRQYDPDYLSTYYQNIEEFGEELSLVKAVDRLDNLLGFQVIERTARINLYLELSDQFVVPLAKRLCPDLGEYLRDVINHMKAVGCDPLLKKQYDTFVAEVVPS